MFDTTDQIAALAKDGNAIIHEEVDGPPYVCRPHYPHFLFPLSSREPVSSVLFLLLLPLANILLCFRLVLQLLLSYGIFAIT